VRVLVEPSHRRGPDNSTKGPAEGGLVREAARQGNLRKWRLGRPQQELRALYSAGDEVTVNRHSEGALEGPREMADRKPALLGKPRKPKPAVQIAVDQFHQAAPLPGRQSTQMDGPCGLHLRIRGYDMAAKHPHEMVEHQAAYSPLVAQPWQCKPGQLKHYIVPKSRGVLQIADPMHFILVCKRIEGSAWQVKVHRIERCGTDCNWTRLQIVDANGTALAAEDGKELSINPGSPIFGLPLLPQMHADRERTFGPSRRRRFR